MIHSSDSTAQRDATYFDIGIELFDEGAFESALSAFNASIEAGERVADSFYMRGRCYLVLDYRAKALRDLAIAQDRMTAFRAEARFFTKLVKQPNLVQTIPFVRSHLVRRTPNAA